MDIFRDERYEQSSTRKNKQTNNKDLKKYWNV